MSLLDDGLDWVIPDAACLDESGHSLVRCDRSASSFCHDCKLGPYEETNCLYARIDVTACARKTDTKYRRVALAGGKRCPWPKCGEPIRKHVKLCRKHHIEVMRYKRSHCIEDYGEAKLLVMEEARECEREALAGRRVDGRAYVPATA